MIFLINDSDSDKTWSFSNLSSTPKTTYYQSVYSDWQCRIWRKEGGKEVRKEGGKEVRKELSHAQHVPSSEVSRWWISNGPSMFWKTEHQILTTIPEWQGTVSPGNTIEISSVIIKGMDFVSQYYRNDNTFSLNRWKLNYYIRLFLLNACIVYLLTTTAFNTVLYKL